MKKIILFGDSIFNGYHAGHDTNVITAGVQKNLDADAQIINLSLSGATTAEGKKRLNLIPQDADIVVLEYGTNDMSSDWGISSTAYAQNLDHMVETIGSAKMIIAGPSYEDPNNKDIMQYYNLEDMKVYNQIAADCARKYHIPFINLIANFCQLENLSSYYQEDGQHLTAAGNQILIDLVVAAIKEKLAQM
ncbi:SGNH/GDSL hydrolase family protein [Lactobacillus sp. M0398]|uniref:SGNH/GDSL hydrolase family protein n=1 Tax=Lactobacillus TaxID=1578 RepID=UPI0018DC9A53|nr:MULTISPECIES: SGNH/GDSL hydrolase family protein [unclassified Lactobacillus]MBI0121001.1 SGNH/GDSL hydrolase family protein [Lactobacillus sp. M0398]MBI0123148.1 SGNH/GDSL hydrolase family protein [Lactobacillus sp. W8174]MBI0135316.1 SGNH/GDSL hydrolase family protein [Lactobacillus sp. W8173]